MIKNEKLRPKPQVTISLEPRLEAFCRLIFKTSTDQAEIKINLNHDIGLLIHSHIKSNHCYRKGPSVTNPVVIVLPINPINTFSINSGFLYVDNWGLQKIENGIKYEFIKWIKRRFEIGYEKNKTRKQIIEAILRGLNLRNNTTNFDAISKHDYRNKRKCEELSFQELLMDDY